MKMMPPGKYWLVARDEVKLDRFKSNSTLYYPGVRDRNQAAVVSIEASKYLQRLDIRLPSSEKRLRIAGRMQFADGTPAPLAKVTFSSSQHGYTETADTAVDGSFALSVVSGMEGQLGGQLAVMEPLLRSCPDLKVGPRRSGMLRFIEPIPITVAADSNREGIKLELPSPSCKSWPAIRE